MRVWIGGPVPPGYSAITVRSTIIVRKRCADDLALLGHELVHVDQWRQHGTVRFLWRYLGDYLRLRRQGHDHHEAYRNIPFEAEAYAAGDRRAAAEDWSWLA